MYDAVREAFEQLDAALDAIAAAEADAREWSPAEIAEHVIASHRAQNRMDALVTKAIGAFDRYGDPQGAVGTAPWVAWKCRVKKSQAKAALSRARALRHMPDADAAYEAGVISSEHVRLLAAGQRSAPDMFEKVEAHLVEGAEQQSFDRFAREMQYFRQVADPDGSAEDALDAFERRTAWAARTFEDTVEAKATLDPVGGSVYLNELDRLERIEFEADWAEARARLGDAATAADLRRSPGQRRADAMVEMAKRSAAKPADAREARVLFTVLIGYETFHGMMSQLADGTVIWPGAVIPWLDDADVERIVFDGPSRVVDVGAKQRLFTGATRRVVEVRDLFCTHESCDVPYERCDIDHVQPWAHDGPTVQANGRVRCPHHNPGRRRPRKPAGDDEADGSDGNATRRCR